jgi:hypothetical protein
VIWPLSLNRRFSTTLRIDTDVLRPGRRTCAGLQLTCTTISIGSTRQLEALGRGADARAEYERLASDRTVPATIREVARRSR